MITNVGQRGVRASKSASLDAALYISLVLVHIPTVLPFVGLADLRINYALSFAMEWNYFFLLAEFTVLSPDLFLTHCS